MLLHVQTHKTKGLHTIGPGANQAVRDLAVGLGVETAQRSSHKRSDEESQAVVRDTVMLAFYKPVQPQ